MTPQRLHFLDCQRGYAALLVMIFHLPGLDQAFPWGYAPVKLLQVGAIGVYIFFVISAFSLAMTMPKHEHSPIGFVSFFVHRICRIMPIFCVMLVMWVVYGNVACSLEALVYNLLGVFNFFKEFQPSLVPAGWTIGVEFPFYYAFPLIYIICKDRRWALILFLMTSSLPYITQSIFLSTSESLLSFLTYIPFFIFGVLLYKAYKKFVFGRQYKKTAYSILFLFVILVIFLHFTSVPAILIDTQKIGGFGSALFITFMFSILPAIAMSLYKIPVIDSAIPAFFGKISYPLYLSHIFVYKIVNEKLGLKYNFFNENCIAIFISIASTILFSVILHYSVEIPSIKLGKYLCNKISFFVNAFPTKINIPTLNTTISVAMFSAIFVLTIMQISRAIDNHKIYTELLYLLESEKTLVHNRINTFALSIGTGNIESIRNDVAYNEIISGWAVGDSNFAYNAVLIKDTQGLVCGFAIPGAIRKDIKTMLPHANVRSGFMYGLLKKDAIGPFSFEMLNLTFF